MRKTTTSIGADGGQSILYSKNGLRIGLAKDLTKEPDVQNVSKDIWFSGKRLR